MFYSAIYAHTKTAADGKSSLVLKLVIEQLVILQYLIGHLGLTLNIKTPTETEKK